MAQRWRFRDYETRAGVIPIRDWLQRQPDQAKANFVTTRKHLSVTETWTIKDGAKPLVQQHRGLTELLIDFSEWAPRGRKGRARRFRPVGVLLELERVFLLFTGAEKVGGELEPPEAFNDALKWWLEWQEGLGTTHEHDF